MTTLIATQAKLNKAYQRHCGGWRAVGAEFGISGGMACRIAKDGYEPKDIHIRLALGLPALAPAPVCVKCGQVHVTRRCTLERKPSPVWRDGTGWWRRFELWELKFSVLEWT